MRAYAYAAVLGILLSAGGWLYWQGIQAERAKVAEAAASATIETCERLLNADIGNGDPVADDAWLRDWLDRVSDAD